MTGSRIEIDKAQAEHAAAPTAFDEIIRRAVLETLRHLDTHPVPVTARVLRESAANRYLGRDSDYLRADRQQARRDGTAPLVPYRKFGKNVLYCIEDLDAVIDSLRRFPEVAR